MTSLAQATSPVAKDTFQWGCDTELFRSINSISGSFYDQCMVIGTALASRIDFPIYLLIFILFAAWPKVRNKSLTPDQVKAVRWRWIQIIAVFVAAFVADTVFLAIMKHVVHRPRPFVVLPPGSFRTLGPVIDPDDYYASFPSGHASFAALIAASLWPELRSYGKAIACFFVVWACWSRIALGAHYPLDVTVGALSAVLIVWLARRVVVKIVKRKGKVPE